MIEAPHYAADGAKQNANFALPAEYFDGTVNEPVLHQAVKVYLNNQRQGTHMTKSRSFVSGGNQKPWKQKGTGRARQGSIRAPHWRGGGIVFGPTPRDYRTEIPRKVRQLARRSALNARAREDAVFVVDSFNFEAPKTRQMLDLLAALDVAERKVLVLTDGVKPAVFLSARNLPNAHVMPYSDASTYHILWSDVVVIESGALGGGGDGATDEDESETTGNQAEAEARVPVAERAARGRRAAKKAGASRRTAKKATRKAAAKRPAAKKSAKKKTARKSTRKRGS
jgi:large subunit ribosomal protein L4